MYYYYYYYIIIIYYYYIIIYYYIMLRSALLCFRGSRAPRRVHLELSDIDLDIEKGHANIR